MIKKIRPQNAAFKAEDVKKIADNNGNISATAKQFDIAMQALSNWQNKAYKRMLIGTKEYDHALMAIIEENKRLKRDIKVAKEERDIIKKAQRTSRMRNVKKQCSRLFSDARQELCSQQG